MVWIVIAIVAAAFIVARAIGESKDKGFPIEDPHHPDYLLACRITEDFIGHFGLFSMQRDLVAACTESLDESKASSNLKETKRWEHQLADTKQALEAMLNDFWSKYGGYRRDLNPDVVPIEVWPPRLAKMYEAESARLRSIFTHAE
ncbi:MAG TPA: hypothetical protein VMR18_00975 [Candidatus Saccharimonadales bacterium]|nr:hypothetical protein [Candidatus Saccharimonadales bacterium]